VATDNASHKKVPRSTEYGEWGAHFTESERSEIARRRPSPEDCQLVSRSQANRNRAESAKESGECNWNESAGDRKRSKERTEAHIAGEQSRGIGNHFRINKQINIYNVNGVTVYDRGRV
jgi:hypothetical protein